MQRDSDGSGADDPAPDRVRRVANLEHCPACSTPRNCRHRVLETRNQGVSQVRFHHVGIPTVDRFEGEIDLPHLQMTVSDHTSNPFGIQWQRYWEGAPYPELVKALPHVAFEVEDLEEALEGHRVIIAPNSPSPGVMVAFIEVAGAPVELLQVGPVDGADSWESVA